MPTLYERIYGCNAAAAIPNSMGDVNESVSYQEIEAQYGLVETLLPLTARDHWRERLEGMRGPLWS